MGEIIDKITIKGYKSIRDLEAFKLGHTNVLIGPNGAGKSNFVSLFRLLRELIDEKLQLALATEGGADACLYLGPKITKELRVKLMFGQNGYEFSLVPTVDNRLVFSSVSTIYKGPLVRGTESPRTLGSGHFEARLRSHKDDSGLSAAKGPPYYVFEALSSWVVYLATALLQPNPPRTMLFDEPELGLHPYALSLLGGMIQKSVAPWGFPYNQIIISTQSALLLNEFTPADVIVVQRAEDQSEFRRLDPEQLSGWLADYTLGELWQKNLLGGRPQIDSAHAIPTSGENS
jgi:predicted ATPase